MRDVKRRSALIVDWSNFVRTWGTETGVVPRRRRRERGLIRTI